MLMKKRNISFLRTVSLVRHCVEIHPVADKALAYIGYDLAEQAYLELPEELRKAK